METGRTLVRVTEEEACLIFGGKSNDIEYLVEMLGMGLGIISKLIWKALKMSQNALLEMTQNGYYSAF